MMNYMAAESEFYMSLMVGNRWQSLKLDEPLPHKGNC